MDPIFNTFKVRFSKLDQIIPTSCPKLQQNSKVNIFINLEMIFNKLATANVDDYLRVKTEEKSYELMSNIINMAAHYRLFFTKNKIYSDVYLYFNHPFRSLQKNRQFNPDYRKDYEHKFTKKPSNMVLSNTLDNVVPFIKIILEHVQGVHLITSDVMESSLTPAIISKKSGNEYVNFIVSNDKYDYQYALKDFYIIRPKKDESYIVNKDNLIHHLKLENKIVNDIEVGANFYPFIISLLGDKHRSIEKIKKVGLGSLLKLLDKAINEGLIGTDTDNISILSDIVSDNYRQLLLNNFYCTDIDTQIKLLNIKDFYHIEEQVKDKFDNIALKEINDRYFLHHPLMILELSGANNLVRRKMKNDIFL